MPRGSIYSNNCSVRCKSAMATKNGAQLTEQVFQKLTRYLTTANQMPRGSIYSNNCSVRCKSAMATKNGAQSTEQVFQKLTRYLTTANQMPKGPNNRSVSHICVC
jgi:hypothetical protein